jgi:pantetheine-phosphate adenylyltransferase
VKVAVYPGSFDPITNGHLDVIGRATAAFDRVIVAVLANPRKQPLLPVDERMAIIREALEGVKLGSDRVEVDSFNGLTVEFCRKVGARFIVRGLRVISDFESEMQLAHNNRKLVPEVDTVFFMTALENGYVSSSLVKEIAAFGGDVSGMVPVSAARRLGGLSRPRARWSGSRSSVLLRRRRVLVALAGSLPDLGCDLLRVPRRLVESRGRWCGAAPTAFGLVELGDPLDHVLGRQPMEFATVQLDFARQRLGLAIHRHRESSLRVAPRR